MSKQDFDRDELVRELKRVCNQLRDVADLVSHDTIRPGTDLTPYNKSTIRYNTLKCRYDHLKTVLSQLVAIQSREDERSCIKEGEEIKLKVSTFLKAIDTTAYGNTPNKGSQNTQEIPQIRQVQEKELLDVQARVHGDVQKILQINGQVTEKNLKESSNTAQNLVKIENDISTVLDSCIEDGMKAKNAADHGVSDMDAAHKNSTKTAKCTWITAGIVGIVLIIVVVILALVLTKKI